MEILNKVAIINGNACYYVSPDSKIVDINKEYIQHIADVYDEARKDNKEVISADELNVFSERVKKNTLMRIKKLENQDRAGYVLVGSLTCIGTLLIAFIIFLAVSFMLR
jgi:hypothetical protein